MSQVKILNWTVPNWVLRSVALLAVFLSILGIISAVLPWKHGEVDGVWTEENLIGVRQVIPSHSIGIPWSSIPPDAIANAGGNPVAIVGMHVGLGLLIGGILFSLVGWLLPNRRAKLQMIAFCIAAGAWILTLLTFVVASSHIEGPYAQFFSFAPGFFGFLLGTIGLCIIAYACIASWRFNQKSGRSQAVI